MLLSLIRYLRGYLRIRIIGYSPERFLNMCSHHHIYLWGLKPESRAYEMYISVRGFRKLKPIIKKTGTKVKIVDRYGLPFFLHKYRKRKMFFAGALLCTVMIYMLSLYIWNIHIDGNYSRTDETLIEFLEHKQVRHGMPKSKVDCDRIVKDIRKEYDDIIWVSASVKGTRLLIQIKENSDKIAEEKKETEKQEEPNDLVAEKDGVITEIVTRSGVPKVKAGKKVKKGDILVCGRTAVKDDAGEVTDYQYHASDADIYAKTTVDYEDQLAYSYLTKDYSGAEKRQNYIKIGDFRFALGSLKHNYKECESSTKETQLRIGEHFYLPLSCGKKVIKHYVSVENTYTDKEMQTLMTSRFQKFQDELEKKGVEILENNVKIYKKDKIARAKGTLTVIEKIGTSAPTEKKQIEKKDKEQTEGEE